mgnify:CR=1 FL=1
MTRARLSPHQRLGAYVATLASMMGLERWRVDVETEPCAEENAATITPGSEFYTASLRVAADFFDKPREEQRDTITHELTHLWLWRFEEVHDLMRAAVRGKGRVSLLSQSYEQAEEYAVDGISRAWAQRLPLPSALKAKRRGEG